MGTPDRTTVAENVEGIEGRVIGVTVHGCEQGSVSDDSL
jgi:hypothetical protein